MRTFADRRASHDDRELARRCAADPSAREALYRAQVQTVYSISYRICGSAAEAEDVVQETFIEAFRCIERFSGRGSLAGWLRRIAIRRTIGLKRRQAAVRVKLKLVEAQRSMNSGDPGARINARARLQRLYQLLESISEDRRLVFILHEVEGYHLPEVAALLDISLTAAKKRAWRARRQVHGLVRKDPLLAGVLPCQESDDAT